MLRYFEGRFSKEDSGRPSKMRKSGGGAAEAAGSAGGREVDMDGILEGKTKMEAARLFYEVLVLKGRNLLSLKQERAFGRISVAPGLASTMGA